MSKLISEIGRKSYKARVLYAAIYVILICGSITMLYPFLLMISGSTRSSVDSSDFSLVPAFLQDDTWLYRKHIEGLFNESPNSMRIAYDTHTASFRDINPPDTFNPLLAEEFETWTRNSSLPWFASTCGYMDTPVSRTKPMNLRLMEAQLQTQHSDIISLNSNLQTQFTSWSSLKFKMRQYLLRHERAVLTGYSRALSKFSSTVPSPMKYYASPQGLFKRMYLPGKYGGTHDHRSLNRKYPKELTDIERNDWEDFVRRVLAAHWLELDTSADSSYQSFLQAKYENIETLNRYYGTGFSTFAEISVTKRSHFLKTADADWISFISGWKTPDSKHFEAPINSISIISPQSMFQDHARTKFKTIERFNNIFGTKYNSFADINIPQADMHYAWFLRNRNKLKYEFCTRNYKAVWSYLVTHGRGIWNTAVYCLLLVLCALTVNPIAAYALSRYRLPSAYKILLFLLCTMAFPPMVTSIPNFLMLRKMGLLNTFAALVLPAMANGYAIFLLKGFFDSQPRELYESAQIDGAKEWTIFWQITMSLSKPILAVIALQAFMLAYSNFMFAFIVCQDEGMWTLMVWLYQLHHRSGQAVMYASLIIAAIPTFIIFLSCQRVIMRGIVVPSEK